MPESEPCTNAMQQWRVEHLPLYPEERTTDRPTAEQVFRLFALIQRHTLQQHGEDLHVFHPELTDLQRQVLALLDVPDRAYQTAPPLGRISGAK